MVPGGTGPTYGQQNYWLLLAFDRLDSALSRAEADLQEEREREFRARQRAQQHPQG